MTPLQPMPYHVRSPIMRALSMHIMHSSHSSLLVGTQVALYSILRTHWFLKNLYLFE